MTIDALSDEPVWTMEVLPRLLSFHVGSWLRTAVLLMVLPLLLALVLFVLLLLLLGLAGVLMLGSRRTSLCRITNFLFTVRACCLAAGKRIRTSRYHLIFFFKKQKKKTRGQHWKDPCGSREKKMFSVDLSDSAAVWPLISTVVKIIFTHQTDDLSKYKKNSFHLYEDFHSLPFLKPACSAWLVHNNQNHMIRRHSDRRAIVSNSPSAETQAKHDWRQTFCRPSAPLSLESCLE